MSIEITTLELNLRIPASIRFADAGVNFDVETSAIRFNKDVIDQVLQASGVSDVIEVALPSEITDAIISLWYQHARSQGQPEDPHMERFLFSRFAMQDEPAANTIH